VTHGDPGALVVGNAGSSTYAVPVIDPVDVQTRLAAVIAAMKRAGAWDVARPADAALVDTGAFGARTMAFEQWLRWIFVPRVEASIASGGPWPGASQVAMQAQREADTNPTVAALVDALDAFDALFSDEPGHDNQAGWQLLSRPGHDRDDLEVAVACFRRSIAREPELPQAAANLGNALVELGREADAILELDRIAAGDGELAATAHNWLGWRLTERDRDRALVHLRDATRLRPSWGVAWQNLARALDAAGDASAACEAYSAAIRCGDSHDDAFARDRRLQLEMQLLARGAPVPAVPGAARADSAAFAIVRATAARLPAPRAFMVRPTTRAIPYAIVGSVVDGRALGHAIVSAGDDWLWSATLARAGDAIVFETTRTSFADSGPIAVAQLAAAPVSAVSAAAAAAPLLAWLAALDPAALTPIDAAMYVRDVVVAGLPGQWTWELASYRPAAVAVHDAAGDIRIVARARSTGGVEIALPPAGAGAAGETLLAATPAQLLELATAIADATRRAVAARDAFANRRFGIRHIAAELAAATHLGAPRLIENYPAWPSAWLSDRTGRFPVAYIVESATGFTIEIGGERFIVKSAFDLIRLVPVLQAAVVSDLRRLRVDRIAPRDRFRVRASFGCFSPGSEVELEGVTVISREGDRAYTFASLRCDARFTFGELDDGHAAVLGSLERYLEPL